MTLRPMFFYIVDSIGNGKISQHLESSTLRRMIVQELQYLNKSTCSHITIFQIRMRIFICIQTLEQWIFFSGYKNLYPDSLFWTNDPLESDRYDANIIFYKISTFSGASGAGVFDLEDRLISSSLLTEESWLNSDIFSRRNDVWSNKSRWLKNCYSSMCEQRYGFGWNCRIFFSNPICCPESGDFCTT